VPLVEPGARRRVKGYRGGKRGDYRGGEIGARFGVGLRGKKPSFFPVFSSFFHFVTLCQLGGETPGVNGDFLESPRNTLGGGLGPKEGLPQGPFLRENPRLDMDKYLDTLWLGTTK